MGRHVRVYRGLLRLYPRSFRAEYGAPMAQLFADRLRDDGPRAWLSAVPDLARTVPLQRIEAVMSKLSGRWSVLAVVAFVLSAMVVVTGVGPRSGVVGIAAFALAVGSLGFLGARQVRVLGSLPVGSRAPLRHATVQAWWAPVAALLGVVTFLSGVGTVFEAHNLGGRIVGSSVLMAFGALTLYGLRRRPFARQAGNTAILLGTLPALTFFWIIVPTALALIVWVGVIAGGFADEDVSTIGPAVS